MHEHEFKKHTVTWKWLAWAGLVLPLAAYIMKSTHDTWPSLFTMAILSGIAVITLSFYVAVHTTDADTPIRNKAILGAVLIEAALIVNAICHGGGSRAYENAKVGEVEAQTKENRAEVIRQNIERDGRERLDKETSLTLAQKDADKAAANRAYAETQRYRTTGVRPSGGQRAPSTSVPSTTGTAPDEQVGSNALAGLETEKSGSVLLTPAQTLESWFWWVFGGLILELVASAIGAFLVFQERVADRDGDNVADWKQRLDPEELRARFPADYERLYGRAPRASRSVRSYDSLDNHDATGPRVWPNEIDTNGNGRDGGRRPNG